MSEINTEIEINAAADEVWKVLTDLSAMPSWNPFIRSMKGQLAEGERIEVQLALSGQSPMTFEPVLLAVKPGRELRWRGSVVAQGVFSGEHAFCLEKISQNRTKLAQSERFSGLLAPLIMSGSRLEATRDGFIAMNEALKRRVESK